MKTKPILFSGPMVRALLDGKKTQTRRTWKKQPITCNFNPPRFEDSENGDLFICPDILPTSFDKGNVIVEQTSSGCYHAMGQRAFVEKHSPYGQPGDLLYVRETWQGWIQTNYEYDEWREVEKEDLSDGTPFNTVYRADSKSQPNRWRPGIHMPRNISRLTLEIVKIRVENLNAITVEDCIAEGCSTKLREHEACSDLKDKYKNIWESINGSGSWAANPWVWVIEFKVHKQNVDEYLKGKAA